MKTLYINIVKFSLPILLVIMLLPMNDLFKYQGLIEDCDNQATWINDRINSNKKPVDVAILGSSHTINGVNDEIIENAVSDTNLSVVNFGYCRLGRNMTYILLKEILKAKKPKYILIEVNEDEDRYSHDIFPMIATTKDIVGAPLLFNRDVFSDFWEHLSYKIDITQDALYQDRSTIPVYREEFGFSSPADTAEQGWMNEVLKDRRQPKTELTHWEREFHMRYPRYYLNAIHKICQQEDIKILFFYLPSYGTYHRIPKEIETYSKYGKVLIPSFDLLDNQHFWYDANHLNRAGAAAYSSWLAEQIDLEADGSWKR